MKGNTYRYVVTPTGSLLAFIRSVGEVIAAVDGEWEMASVLKALARLKVKSKP